MFGFMVRRILLMIPTVLAVTLVTFGIIALYEHFNGDFVTQLKFNPNITQETIDRYAENLGLNRPWYERYFIWLKGIVTEGQFGYSFYKNQPVGQMVMDYLPITMLITLPTFVFIWLVSIPLGIFSSTHQYSVGDHSLTFMAFIGLSTPVFFSALVVLYLLVIWDYPAVGGIFSQQYIAGSPWPWHWSFGKFVDYLTHLWPAILVIGGASVAGLMRVMRGTMLDIVSSQYVQTARAKGLSERVVIYKHAVRNAINPMVSIFGQQLPILVSGSLLAAQVLNLPNLEIAYFRALQPPDEYFVVTVITFFSLFLLIGNLIADILLAWIDPRVRYD